MAEERTHQVLFAFESIIDLAGRILTMGMGSHADIAIASVL